MNLRPLIALLALGGFPPLALATPVSPASQVFERGLALVERYYNGPRPLKSATFVHFERATLNQRCELTPTICSVSIGREVLADYLDAYEDGHLGVLSPDRYAALKARVTAQVLVQPTYGLVLDELGNGQDVIVDIAAGSPAEHVGLQPGDRIVTVNGGPAPDGSTLDDTPELRLEVARGPVKADVRRAVTLTRTSLAPLFLPTLYAPPGGPPGVLVLRIPSFFYAGQVGPRVHELVRAAQTRGARALIVDLRSGPGGSQFECEMAAGAFTGPFQYREDTKLGAFPQGWTGTRSFDTADRAFVGIAADLSDASVAYNLPQPARWTGQVAVLVDYKTASCHEYMAYFLQRFIHAKVIGTTTGGVLNSSDIAVDLPGGAGLLMPVGRPSNTDGSPFPAWVTPDVPASSDVQRFADSGVDPVLEVAYKTLGLISAP